MSLFTQVRFKEEEDQKLKLEVEEIRRKRKLKEQQQLEEKRLLRAQQKAILEVKSVLPFDSGI